MDLKTKVGAALSLVEQVLLEKVLYADHRESKRLSRTEQNHPMPERLSSTPALEGFAHNTINKYHYINY